MPIDNTGAATLASGGVRPYESSVSAVSWPAVFAGTLVAVAVTFILMALGSGVGFATVSPWPGHGASATTFTVVTAIWLLVVQWGSSALGGYTTGRLRTKWAGVHTHEVFFRDTAHGLLTWATATVFGALLLASAALHTANHSMQAAVIAATADGGRAMHRFEGAEGGYALDKLFRSASAEPISPERYGEVSRTLHGAVASGSLSPEDRTYLSRLVAARSGIPAEEAQTRVENAYAEMQAAEERAKKEADEARAAAAKLSLFTALSMFVGAFIACVAAAMGGRLRDEHL
jgi:hypothetical protein